MQQETARDASVPVNSNREACVTGRIRRKERLCDLSCKI